MFLPLLPKITLKDVDRIGQLAGAPRAAAELAQDPEEESRGGPCEEPGTGTSPVAAANGSP